MDMTTKNLHLDETMFMQTEQNKHFKWNCIFSVSGNIILSIKFYRTIKSSNLYVKFLWIMEMIWTLFTTDHIKHRMFLLRRLKTEKLAWSRSKFSGPLKTHIKALMSAFNIWRTIHIILNYIMLYYITWNCHCVFIGNSQNNSGFFMYCEKK